MEKKVGENVMIRVVNNHSSHVEASIVPLKERGPKKKKWIVLEM